MSEGYDAEFLMLLTLFTLNKPDDYSLSKQEVHEAYEIYKQQKQKMEEDGKTKNE